MNHLSQKAPPLEKALADLRKRAKSMSREEAIAVLAKAGILTEKGNVRKPYRKVIVPVGK